METLATLTVTSPPWMKKALCAEADPELFFSHPGEDGESERTATALSICKRCSVRVECLLWAFAEGDEWGILGAKTPRERQEILRGRTERLRRIRAAVMSRIRRPTSFSSSAG